MHRRTVHLPRVAFRYCLFAVIATMVNLVAQDVVYSFSPFAALPLSILVGTAAGFATKYVLDKKCVFSDGYGSHRGEVQKLALYAAFSVATTLVFWSIEMAFWMAWRTDLARYAGAAIGLGIGYAAKFSLDRKFVFKEC